MWGTEPRLVIQHHLDRWYVYHKINEGTLGTDEYIFDTFEDVMKWVIIRYPQLEEERIERYEQNKKAT